MTGDTYRRGLRPKRKFCSFSRGCRPPRRNGRLQRPAAFFYSAALLLLDRRSATALTRKVVEFGGDCHDAFTMGVRPWRRPVFRKVRAACPDSSPVPVERRFDRPHDRERTRVFRRRKLELLAPPRSAEYEPPVHAAIACTTSLIAASGRGTRTCRRKWAATHCNGCCRRRDGRSRRRANRWSTASPATPSGASLARFLTVRPAARQARAET